MIAPVPYLVLPLGQLGAASPRRQERLRASADTRRQVRRRASGLASRS